MASLLDNLRAGIATPGEDPVRILVPAALAMLAQGFMAAWAWQAVADRAGAAVAVLAVTALGPIALVPLRAMVLGHGARALGRPARILRGLPALVVVEVVLTAASTLVFAVPAGLGAALGLWVLLSGWYTLGMFVAFAGALIGALLSTAARVAWAYAPAEVLVGGRGPLDALSRGRPAGPDWLPLLAIFAFGGGLSAVGALSGGALSLPLAPFVDLAVLHRWSNPSSS